MGSSGGAAPPGDTDVASTVVAGAGEAPTLADGPSGRSREPVATLSVDHGDLPDLGSWTADDRGRYLLGNEIARGGGGRVVAARDVRLGRDVAVKLPLDAPGSLERLVREAQLISRLEHPAIVAVHDLTRAEDGTPFYVMKLLDGETLRARIAGQTFEDRIALLPTLIAICDAVAYAHHRGIVHRDLKPANVIVGAFGETAVIDWGLARARGRASDAATAAPAAAGPDITAAGAVVGTPAYMAPEQARGADVDVRADVYGLGAVLYHVLGGAAPYQAGDSTTVIARVLEGPPAPVTTLEPRLPPDLAAIVAKAMARAPADRYDDAGQLAADLRRYQAGRLVAAHRYSPWQRLRRWARRRRVALAAGVAVAAAAAAVAIAWPARGVDPRAMCAHAGDPLDTVWTPAVRTAIADRVRASQGPGAATAATAVTDRLDAYARALGAARVEACAATHVRGAQSPALLDLRMLCLDRRQDDLTATLGLFAAVAAADIEPLVRAVDALPDPGPCADPETLRGRRPLPADPATRDAMRALLAQLASARALQTAGRFSLALATARTAAASPVIAVDPQLEAEVHLRIGALLGELYQTTEAEAELRTAAHRADAAGADGVRADALHRLAQNARVQKRYDDATRLVAELTAVAQRIGDRELEIRGLDVLAAVAEERGNVADAIALQRRAADEWQRAGLPELGLADLAGNVGSRLHNASRYKDALPYLERSRAIFARYLGPDHPNQARTLSNLGGVTLALGDAAAGLAQFEQAWAIFERAGLADSEEGILALSNIAAALVMLGRHDEAEVRLQELLVRTEKALGPGATTIGTTLYNLGNGRLLRGDAAAAEPWFRKAVDFAVRTYGDRDVRTAYMRWGLAAALLELDRTREAMPLLTSALPIQLAETGPGSDDVSFTQLSLARGYLQLGQPARALEYALVIQPYFDDYPDAGDRGTARLLLATALHQLGRDRPRSLALAEAARPDLHDAGKTALTAEADALLAALRAP